MTMVTSRPGPSAEDVQKIRTRLAGGDLPGTQAAVQTEADKSPPLLTPEQAATAAANLKARMDARRTAGVQTASGAVLGTRVSASVSTPVPAPHNVQTAGPRDYGVPVKGHKVTGTKAAPTKKSATDDLLT